MTYQTQTLEERIQTAYRNSSDYSEQAQEFLSSINDSIFSAWGNSNEEDKSCYTSYEQFESDMLCNADYEADGYNLELLEIMF